MIDAGTISASLILDTAPFSFALSKALLVLSELGITGDEQGGRLSALGDVLGRVGGRVQTEFQSPFQRAAEAVRQTCGSITGSVSGTALNVVKPAIAVKSNILSPIKETVSDGKAIMTNFGQGLINGLSSKQSGIMAKARSIANSVAATMRKALGIASPSRVMREVGRFTGEGMVLGLQDMSGEVTRASKALAQSAVTTVSINGTMRNDGSKKREDTAEVYRTETTDESTQDILCRRLDTLIELLANSRQSIQLDRRSFGVLVREYT